MTNRFGIFLNIRKFICLSIAKINCFAQLQTFLSSAKLIIFGQLENQLQNQLYLSIVKSILVLLSIRKLFLSTTRKIKFVLRNSYFS